MPDEKSLSEESDPLVSITICAYNAEKYIPQTLESVFQQTYKNIEILVVDDGSTDGTPEILESAMVHDGRLKVFHEKHEGLAASRNKAFEYASGEWIAIIDADDICYPERIRTQLERSREVPEADLIFGDTDYIDERGHKIGRHLSKFKLPLFIPKGKAANYLLRYGCFVDSEAFFARKRAIENAGVLDCSLKYATDYDFFIRLGFHSSFAEVPAVLGGWRIHRDQMTNYYSPTVAKENRQVYCKYFLDRRVKMWTKLILSLKMAKSLVADLRSGSKEKY